MYRLMCATGGLSGQQLTAMVTDPLKNIPASPSCDRVLRLALVIKVNYKHPTTLFPHTFSSSSVYSGFNWNKESSPQETDN